MDGVDSFISYFYSGYLISGIYYFDNKLIFWSLLPDNSSLLGKNFDSFLGLFPKDSLESLSEELSDNFGVSFVENWMLLILDPHFISGLTICAGFLGVSVKATYLGFSSTGATGFT